MEMVKHALIENQNLQEVILPGQQEKTAYFITTPKMPSDKMEYPEKSEFYNNYSFLPPPSSIHCGCTAGASSLICVPRSIVSTSSTLSTVTSILEQPASATFNNCNFYCADIFRNQCKKRKVSSDNFNSETDSNLSIEFSFSRISEQNSTSDHRPIFESQREITSICGLKTERKQSRKIYPKKGVRNSGSSLEVKNVAQPEPKNINSKTKSYFQFDKKIDYTFLPPPKEFAESDLDEVIEERNKSESFLTDDTSVFSIIQDSEPEYPSERFDYYCSKNFWETPTMVKLTLIDSALISEEYTKQQVDPVYGQMRVLHCSQSSPELRANEAKEPQPHSSFSTSKILNFELVGSDGILNEANLSLTIAPKLHDAPLSSLLCKCEPDFEIGKSNQNYFIMPVYCCTNKAALQKVCTKKCDMSGYGLAFKKFKNPCCNNYTDSDCKVKTTMPCSCCCKGKTNRKRKSRIAFIPVYRRNTFCGQERPRVCSQDEAFQKCLQVTPLYTQIPTGIPYSPNSCNCGNVPSDTVLSACKSRTCCRPTDPCCTLNQITVTQSRTFLQIPTQNNCCDAPNPCRPLLSKPDIQCGAKPKCSILTLQEASAYINNVYNRKRSRLPVKCTQKDRNNNHCIKSCRPNEQCKPTASCRPPSRCNPPTSFIISQPPGSCSQVCITGCNPAPPGCLRNGSQQRCCSQGTCKPITVCISNTACPQQCPSASSKSRPLCAPQCPPRNSQAPTCTPPPWSQNSPTRSVSNRITCVPTCEPNACATSCAPTRQPSCAPTCESTGCATSCAPTRQTSCTHTSQPIYTSNCQPSCTPTCQPSRAITCQPTCVPSCQRTYQPNCAPTCRPTCAPTCQPTCAPTCQSNYQPTCAPTCQSTCQPTCAPSCQRTCQPNCAPTCQPTCAPTCQPTCAPTCQPTCAPTCQPTCAPTCQPTCAPTCQRTCQPTCAPTCQRTCQPTCAPTCQPNCAPTGQSTCQPNCAPTCQPTCTPTGQSTDRPTCGPTYQPTCAPTCQRTCQPTCPPTCQRNCQPTCSPTCQPTYQHTCAPTCQRTCQPNCATTCQSTDQPTCAPTFQSSYQPTCAPTYQRTCQPNCAPTYQRTCQPNCATTCQRTCQPTCSPNCQSNYQPNCAPTCQSTCQPTCAPTCQSTCQPTCAPTYQSTCQPNGAPTCPSTCQPTCAQNCRPACQLPCTQFCQPTCQTTCVPNCQPVCTPTCPPVTAYSPPSCTSVCGQPVVPQCPQPPPSCVPSRTQLLCCPICPARPTLESRKRKFDFPPERSPPPRPPPPVFDNPLTDSPPRKVKFHPPASSEPPKQPLPPPTQPPQPPDDPPEFPVMPSRSSSPPTGTMPPPPVLPEIDMPTIQPFIPPYHETPRFSFQAPDPPELKAFAFEMPEVPQVDFPEFKPRESLPPKLDPPDFNFNFTPLDLNMNSLPEPRKPSWQATPTVFPSLIASIPPVEVPDMSTPPRFPSIELDPPKFKHSYEPTDVEMKLPSIDFYAVPNIYLELPSPTSPLTGTFVPPTFEFEVQKLSIPEVHPPKRYSDPEWPPIRTPPGLSLKSYSSSPPYSASPPFEIPKLPSIPKEPSHPKEPNFPKLPSLPKEPSLPKPPSLPKEPSLPKQPSLPKEPSLPKPPSIPKEPSLPKPPSIPKEPSLPKQPSLPKEPSLPKSKQPSLNVEEPPDPNLTPETFPEPEVPRISIPFKTDEPEFRNPRLSSVPRIDEPEFRNPRLSSVPRIDEPEFRNPRLSSGPRTDVPEFRNPRLSSGPRTDVPDFRNPHLSSVPRTDVPDFRNPHLSSVPRTNEPDFRNPHLSSVPRTNEPDFRNPHLSSGPRIPSFSKPSFDFPSGPSETPSSSAPSTVSTQYHPPRRSTKRRPSKSSRPSKFSAPFPPASKTPSPSLPSSPRSSFPSEPQPRTSTPKPCDCEQVCVISCCCSPSQSCSKVEERNPWTSVCCPKLPPRRPRKLLCRPSCKTMTISLRKDCQNSPIFSKCCLAPCCQEVIQCCPPCPPPNKTANTCSNILANDVIPVLAQVLADMMVPKPSEAGELLGNVMTTKGLHPDRVTSSQPPSCLQDCNDKFQISGYHQHCKQPQSFSITLAPYKSTCKRRVNGCRKYC